MNSPYSLKELQTWLKNIIIDPHGAEFALSRSHIKARDVISEDRTVKPVRRLNVYAEAYFSRICDSMQSDFSKLFESMGEPAFQQLVADYIQSSPSRTHNITEIGEHFSNFISSHVYSVEAPYLPELAELEWAIVKSFYHSSQSNTGLVNSSLQILTFGFDILPIWQSPAIDEVTQRTSHLAVWHFDGLVQTQKLDEVQFEILSRLKIGVALDCVFDNISAGELNETTIQNWFGHWANRGLITMKGLQ